jgi:8-oxo-dGTP diphosphatase
LSQKALPVPYTSVIDVLLLLERDGQVLLALRQNTGYADGEWNVPSGKLEHGEDLVKAMMRESREEIALPVRRNDLELVTTVHHLTPEGRARIGFFFRARHWHGEPTNAEPDKCSRIAWFPLTALPDNTVPYTRVGIDQFRRAERFGLLGWPPTPETR